MSCHCNRETICSQVKQNIKAVFEQRSSLWSLSDPSANGQIVGREVGEKKENEKEEIWQASKLNLRLDEKVKKEKENTRN